MKNNKKEYRYVIFQNGERAIPAGYSFEGFESCAGLKEFCEEEKIDFGEADRGYFYKKKDAEKVCDWLNAPLSGGDELDKQYEFEVVRITS
jgi:hypothetical protein